VPGTFLDFVARYEYNACVPRRPRTWDPGGIYHLTPKGNDGRVLFRHNVDRREILHRCDLVTSNHDLSILGYCLMDNHCHFLVRCGDEGLSQAICELFGGYSRWCNERYGRTGHLFHNRCYATHVQTDAHLLLAARYIDLNPVTAGLVARPEDYRWSSYRAHVGLDFPLPLLANDEFLQFFGRSPRAGRANYRRFVRDWRSAQDARGPGPVILVA
jgi:REP element-mobilizing transposase RayT